MSMMHAHFVRHLALTCEEECFVPELFGVPLCQSMSTDPCLPPLYAQYIEKHGHPPKDATQFLRFGKQKGAVVSYKKCADFMRSATNSNNDESNNQSEFNHIPKVSFTNSIPCATVHSPKITLAAPMHSSAPISKMEKHEQIKKMEIQEIAEQNKMRLSDNSHSEVVETTSSTNNASSELIPDAPKSSVVDEPVQQKRCNTVCGT